jgi:hypothetical protein
MFGISTSNDSRGQRRMWSPFPVLLFQLRVLTSLGLLRMYPRVAPEDPKNGRCRKKSLLNVRPLGLALQVRARTLDTPDTARDNMGMKTPTTGKFAAGSVEMTSASQRVFAGRYRLKKRPLPENLSPSRRHPALPCNSVATARGPEIGTLATARDPTRSRKQSLSEIKYFTKGRLSNCHA